MFWLIEVARTDLFGYLSLQHDLLECECSSFCLQLILANGVFFFCFLRLQGFSWISSRFYEKNCRELLVLLPGKGLRW